MDVTGSKVVLSTVEFLKNLPQIKSPGSSIQLPSMSMLASMANVSKPTMKKAVDILVDRGTLLSLPRKGIFLTDSYLKRSGLNTEIRDTFPPAIRASAWQRTKDQFEQDILNGNFEPGQVLPKSKELQGRYGISFRTLKKVLNGLHKDGLIEPHGNTFRIKLLSSKKSSLKLFVIWFMEPESSTIAVPETFYDRCLRFLEDECVRRQVSIDFIYEDKDKDETYLKFRHLTSREEVDFSGESENSLGCIDFLRLPTKKIRERLGPLAKLDRPVALLDTHGDVPVQDFITHRPLFRSFAISTGMDAGRQVGQYLLSLGHKNMAFFSPFHRHQWSLDRYEGINQIYRNSGSQKDVFLFADTTHERTTQFYELGADSIGLTSLREAYKTWREGLAPEYIIQFDPLIEWAFFDSTVRGKLNAIMCPYFEQAIQNSAITTWVAVNDIIALMAWDFLRAKEIRVPDDISLISFDDSLAAARSRLTSFNFNAAAMANALLDHIIQPRSVTRFKSRKQIKINGYIVERGSTKKK